MLVVVVDRGDGHAPSSWTKGRSSAAHSDARTAGADELLVLDDAGARLRIHAIQGTARFEGDSYPPREGRSDVLVVSERARTLVLLKLGAEVKRVPLALTDEALNVVRP